MNPQDTEKIEWSILIVIIIGTFMAILDSSIVNVALPKMMVIFNVTTDEIQWILTAYMLTLGVVMPLSGYLGDTYGYKRIYMIALGTFIVGSFLCGLAWNVNSMIAARIVQALGGGIMQPLGMAIIYQSFPRSKIGMVLGFWGIAAMAAPAIGPTLGGYLVDYVNWRLIFFINIPIGLINFFLAGIILRETQLIKGKHLDYMGVFTSVVGLFCLLLALSEGTKEGWSSPYIVSLFAISAVTLVGFVFNELNHPEPILDLRVFKNTVFSISIIIGSFLAIGMFGAIFLLPLLLQNVFGQTAMKTGLIMFPGAIASGLMMPISGRIFDKYGARGIASLGLILVIWTGFVMSGFTESTAFSAITWWIVIRGLGMGFSMMSIATAGMNEVPVAMVGRASALSNVVRQVAASFGIAILTTILQNRQVYHFANLAQSVNMSANEVLAIQGQLQSMATSLGIGAAGIPTLQYTLIGSRLMKLSLNYAIGDCLIVASVFCVAAVALIPFLRQTRPHMGAAPGAAVQME
ncbi:MAG: DHA2 family efflux MFS transporter permease subunit [Acidobacteriota bacterium]